MSTPFAHDVVPKYWLGDRDDVSPTEIADNEWVDSLNVDARFAKRRDGKLELMINDGTSPVKAVTCFRKPTGDLARFSLHVNGAYYEDTTLKGSMSTTYYPYFGHGAGYLCVVNGVNAPLWRDPADNTWKAMQGVPSGWLPRCITVHPLSRRIFLAPTTSGKDCYAWSNSDPTGTNMSFVATGNGGSEPIGGKREPITSMMGGIGDDLNIYTENQIYQIRGSDPATWKVRFVSNDVGNVAPRALDCLGHGHVIVHYSGVYLVNVLGALTFPPLTSPKQRAWDVMLKAYQAYFPYIHGAWNAWEHTYYLFLPTGASDYMGKLWKFYLPDGSISIQDVPAYSCAFEPPMKMLGGMADGRVVDLIGASTDLGAAITGWLKTKIYGDPKRTKTWGVQEKMVVLFRPLASGSVTVTPYIYREGAVDPIAGTAQSVSLTTSGDVVRATIYLPPSQGWGLQLLITGTSQFEFLGFHVEGMQEDLE